MREFLRTLLGLLLVAGVGFALGAGYGRRTARDRVRLEVINDTTIITTHDTITRERPVYLTSYIYDTIRTHFTTIERDTVLVDVPIERRVYAEDSLYRAVVSGWRPSLDTLVVWPTVTTITIRERVKTPAPRLSFGITAGPSVLATPSGGVHAGVGVTAGLQYRF